ncbi:hypothetical protein GEMRC1_004243 [Eukaryota sp. GEM-RC1]
MDDFSVALARIIVLQISHARDVKTMQYSSIDVLSSMLSKFILEVGHRSNREAHLNNRYEVSTNDILLALSSLNYSPRDLLKHLAAFEDIPFSVDVSSFPLHTDPFLVTSFSSPNDDAPTPSYVPSFLPSLPPKDLVLDSSIEGEPLLDTLEVKRVLRSSSSTNVERTDQEKELPGLDIVKSIFSWS